MMTIRLLLPLLLLTMSACSNIAYNQPRDARPEVVESLGRYKKVYTLAPGDVLEVSVYRHPELTSQGAVRSDGNFTLMLIDDVKAAGLTVRQFDEAVTGLYAVRMVDPEVSVFLKNAREPRVFVLGEVGRPGPVPFREAPTAAQAIALAGGMTRAATTDSIALIRLSEDGRLVAYRVGAGTMGESASYMSLQDTALMQDDLIVVPEKFQSKFARFVTDYINTPAGGVNSVLSPYFQFRLIDSINNND